MRYMLVLCIFLVVADKKSYTDTPKSWCQCFPKTAFRTLIRKYKIHMVNSSAFVGISSVSFHNGHSWLGPASSTFTLRWRSLVNTLDGATRFFL